MFLLRRLPSSNLARGLGVSTNVSVLHGEPTPLSTSTICSRLDHHALSFPTAIAVEDIEGNRLTYDEIQTRSVQLAYRLQALGVSCGDRVCLVLERSLAHIVAVFSVLRLGAAYIPLDGALIPTTALSDIIRDAEPAVVLVSRTHLPRFEDIKMPSYCLEELIETGTSEHIASPYDNASPQDPAYIIYTSGTTGKPKGVVVSHGNVLNLVSQSPGSLHVHHGTKVAQLLNVGFDMCAWEIFSCILNGGSLYLRGCRRADWLKVMKTVEVIISTPSILEPHDPEDFPNVKVVATAGEPCSKRLADRWAKRVLFYNCCGPTEVTIVNTMGVHSPGEDVTIGSPTPNNSVYVLDDKLRPLPLGRVGVMWAGGVGVSLGYLNRPELSNIKYRPDPFRADGGKMYNTGDLGRILADGRIEHYGRIDDQVKVKGFRVELDGVSAAMRTCPGISSACALLIGQEIWGFYSPQSIPGNAVRAAVILSQPGYAVPTQFVALQFFPLTSNGKVDKQTLRALAHSDTLM